MKTLEWTVFSTDYQDTPLSVVQLTKLLREYGVPSKQCYGSYKGSRECCWIVRKSDFDQYIRDSLYLLNQESVMHVSACKRMYARLEYLSPRFGQKREKPLGVLKQTTQAHAQAQDDYLWVPGTGWFVAVALPQQPSRAAKVVAFLRKAWGDKGCSNSSSSPASA